MAIIKLTEPSQAHTMTIVKVEDDRSGNYPDWKFTSDTGDVLHVPQKAMERQLTRLSVQTAFDLKGCTVRFSRSDKPGTNGKLFYNADLAAPHEAHPQPSRRVASPHQPKPASGPIGGAHVPDMDDDEPYSDGAALDGIPDWHRNVPPADAPAPPPRETREAATGVTDRERHYLALWDRVAAHLTVTCQRHRIPLDASAVQAATFSIFNQR